MDRQLRARVLIAEAETLGISLADLIAAAKSAGANATPAPVPTVSAYLEVIRPTFTKGTRSTYDTYWRLFEQFYGSRLIDTITVDECEAVRVEASHRALARRPGCTGRSAQENYVAAIRALFRKAERARLVVDNPAAEIGKPNRLASRRRALTEIELTEAIQAVRTESRDLELDLLLVEFHLVSGARREGALNLTLDDLDERRCTVLLLEKGGKEREQPISRSLLRRIRALALRRGAVVGTDKVFRTKRNQPVSRRRYNTLFDRVQAALPWSIRTPVTAHVLRHTAGRTVERLAGKSVAQAFLGHGPSDVTGIYTQATIDEVAAVVSCITGEPHPLAAPDWRPHRAAA